MRSEIVYFGEFIVNWFFENLIIGNDLVRLIFLVDKFDERLVVD